MSGANLQRPWRLAPLLILSLIGPEPTTGQDPPRTAPPRWSAPTSLFDPRLSELRLASATWEARQGPERAVVDQVCLVPDLPTFLEAIATWDRGHMFPILFDDVESSFRFIRAFKPARVIRLPKTAPSVPREQLWARAVKTVGDSWSGGGSEEKPRGDEVPRMLGPTPPGVVVSSPEAPMIAGAVALAAGRFQPLLRFESAKHFGEVLGEGEVRALASDLSQAIREKVLHGDGLGDECDFVTVAGDWPFRYKDAKGEIDAVDDRLGRSAASGRRWAFAGRILGDATQSVYRAMCSLFLQPDSALMFNGYDESSPPWSEYSTHAAALRLSGLLPTSQVSGDRQAGIDGWHETFDPSNKHGLVLINSHGSPTVFNLRSGPAGVADIPRGVPSAVLMIHSFSASDPNDPSTVAGRWLANGAFVFFGSMNEPYLAAFRAPRLVGDLLGERIPAVAAVRATMAEPFGQPWRLVFLGDPLFRLKARTKNEPRLASWEPTAGWPAYVESPKTEGLADPELFLWALKTAIARLTRGSDEAPSEALIETISGIHRDRLPPSFRPTFDSLLIEVLFQAKKRGALRSRIATIPEAERSPSLRRCYETLYAIDLSLVLARGDASKSRAAWSELIRAELPREFKEQATTRVGQLADTPIRRQEWAEVLRLALRSRSGTPDADLITAELKRVEESNARARPAAR